MYSKNFLFWTGFIYFLNKNTHCYFFFDGKFHILKRTCMIGYLVYDNSNNLVKRLHKKSIIINIFISCLIHSIYLPEADPEQYEQQQSPGHSERDDPPLEGLLPCAQAQRRHEHLHLGMANRRGDTATVANTTTQLGWSGNLMSLLTNLEA